MLNANSIPLQKAIYQALSGNAPLSALITGVYDHVPQSSTFPYITIGDAICYNWSTKTTAGLEQLVKLHIWSREGGRKQALDLLERVSAALNADDLIVEGQTLVQLRFISSQVSVEADGHTHHGMLQFKALLQID